jgi:hypothetical protein
VHTDRHGHRRIAAIRRLVDGPAPQGWARHLNPIITVHAAQRWHPPTRAHPSTAAGPLRDAVE